MSVFMGGTLAGGERDSVIQVCPSCEKDVKDGRYSEERR
jgi:hypothetical protein